MRVLVIDTDGRPLVNTTINIATEHPDPAYSFKETSCALVDPDRTQDPQYFLSKLQIVLSYLGTACLSRLVTRFNSAIQDPCYHRSVMEEQAIANELSQAVAHVTNAYHRIKPYSMPAANALAKISNDLGTAYSKIRDRAPDPFSSLDLSPRNHFENADIPQPEEGLGKTFFRQRPKESWVKTALRVLSEDGQHCLDELHGNNAAVAKQAAFEYINLKRATDSLNVQKLQALVGSYFGAHANFLNEPRSIKADANPVLGLGLVRKQSIYTLQNSPDTGLDSPLRAQAAPFTPVGRTIIATMDANNPLGTSGYGAASGGGPSGHVRASTVSAVYQAPNLYQPLAIGAERSVGPTPAHQLPYSEPEEAPTPKRARFGHIGQERKKSVQLQLPPAIKKKAQEYTPEHRDDEDQLTDQPEDDPQLTHQHGANEDDEETLTPVASNSRESTASPQFEVNGPDSPTYKTWAQKAAVTSDETGWERVEKGKKVAHSTVAVKQNIIPTVIQHKAPQYVVIRGCRASTTLSDITSAIDCGALISIALEKSPADGGITAKVLFIQGSNAHDLIAIDLSNRASHGQSIFGPDITVALGGGYGGAQSDLRGMFVAVNHAGRSDGGAHFERRRLTFSGNSMALTEKKLRNSFITMCGVQEQEIEVIVIFNPGNATTVFASVFAARNVRRILGARKDWKQCKIMYSSDPCEKHLSFMDKVKKDAQANRAEIVRRAFQKAGNVHC